MTEIHLRAAPPRRGRASLVTLVRPPVITLGGSLSTHGPTPPIGLAYIASTLRSAGHEVAVVDAPGEGIDRTVDIDSPIGPLQRRGLSNEAIADRIPVATDIIGVSLMFIHEWPETRRLLDHLRERFPRAVIVLGGETATSYWSHMQQETDAIDFVVLGEGEATIVELVDRLATGASTDDLQGVVTLSPRAPAIDTGLPVRMRRLTEVPRPAWDLIDLDRYFEHPYFGVDLGRSMPVLATRGCPYQCTFCSSPQMWTTRYVVREPEDVVDEIAEYVQRYGISNVNFCDLTAITKRQWTLDFCDALERRGLDITWQLPVGTRAEALDEQVLRRLYETGCRNVGYAPESGSERMLAILQKKVKLPHLLASVGMAHDIGLKTHVNVIIGHPAERWSDLWQSCRLLARAALLGCDSCAPIMFCPYPGSADFDALVAEGKLAIDETTCFIGLSRTSAAAQSFNPVLSARTLRVMQLAMLGGFHAIGMTRRPRKLVDFIRAQATGHEVTYLDQMVFHIRRRRRPLRAAA